LYLVKFLRLLFPSAAEHKTLVRVETHQQNLRGIYDDKLFEFVIEPVDAHTVVHLEA
jgi:hypothetical protein